MSILLLKNEQWLPVSGYEGLYNVSNFGRIISLGRKHYKHKPRLRKPGIRCKYYYLNLIKNSKIKCFQISRLVAIAFLGDPKPGYEINHKDGNKLNNHLSNLEWVTRKENIQHAWRIGLCEGVRKAVSEANRGEGNANAKLTEAKVKAIRKSKLSISALAIQYGVAYITVYFVKKRILWKHVK